MLGAEDGESGYLIKGEEYLYILQLKDNTSANSEIKINFPEQDLFEIKQATIDGNSLNENIYLDESTGEITLSELKGNCEIYVSIIPKETTSKEKLANIYAKVSCGDTILRTNAIQCEIKGIDLQVDIQANNSGEEVKVGQEIEYTITIKNPEDSIDLDTITIKDNNLSLMTVKELLLNGNKMEKDMYTLVRIPTASEENDEVITGDYNETELTINTDLKAGETKIVKIKCEVSEEASWLTEETEIKNHAEVSTEDYSANAETVEVIHLVKPVERDNYTENYNKNDYIEDDPNNPLFPDEPADSDDNKPSKPETPNTPNDSEDEQKEKTYTISGMAWFDENENGIKDIQEQRLSGITAKLMNLNTNEISNVTTSESGFYSFTGLKNGKYVVIFEYDTEEYMLTTYQVEGANSSSNSDVENVTMKIDGQDKKVSSTDTLEINNNSRTDIDIGLVLARTFDLELTKTISKVSVINDEGTETTNYNDVTYAKAEIHAKHIESSTVVVEYKIKVTNTGELAGYVKSIVDYKPVDLVFDSSLNNGWYQEGDNLYSNSLAETKLEAGESKELTLVLTKQMTENNMGLVNNLAEIAEAETLLGVEDIDSIPGNKKRGEDDLGSSDLSIGVKTGAAVSYIMFTISSIVILLASSYLISIKIIKERRKI